MFGDGYLASFIGMTAGEAVFAGLYRIAGAKEITFSEFWHMPENVELAGFGMIGWKKEDSDTRTLWFDLQLSPICKEWRGRLTVSWPPPERSWFRRSERNEMRVLSIPKESLFGKSVPGWETICLNWHQLQVIPSSWRAAFAQWRGIYFIYDKSDGRGYVGSAYGADNLLGRWLQYARSGDGGNKLLRSCKPENLRFSILQRVSPDMVADEVIRLESSWKDRLHTRSEFGLNVN
jgi:hypothetical protein